MAFALVLVKKVTREHLHNADLNVLQALNAYRIKLVFANSVRIHAMESVEPMQIVGPSITDRFVLANTTTKEIHMLDAVQ